MGLCGGSLDVGAVNECDESWSERVQLPRIDCRRYDGRSRRAILPDPDFLGPPSGADGATLVRGEQATRFFPSVN